MKTILIIMLSFFALPSKAQWGHSSKGLPIYGVYVSWYEGVNTIAKSGTTLYVSQNKRIFKSTDKAENWVEITSKFPTDSRYLYLAGNDSRMFASFDTLVDNVRHGNVFYTSDDGETWVDTGLKGNPYEAYAVKGDVIYIYGNKSNSYRSDDGGDNWISLAVPERGSAMCITENDDVYIASDNHLYRSTDKGQTWNELPSVGASPSLYAFGNTIYAGSRSSLSKSTDGAQTWTSIKEGLPDIKKSILYVKDNVLLVSIGEASWTNGVYISTDGGETWATFNDGYPALPFTAAIVELDEFLYSGGGMSKMKDAGVYKRPVSQVITSIMQTSEVVSEFKLTQNYPNPFNPSTNINYQLDKAGFVQLEVFTVLGQRILVLVNQQQAAGSYSVKLDALGFTSGVYLVRLTQGDNVSIQKISLIK